MTVLCRASTYMYMYRIPVDAYNILYRVFSSLLMDGRGYFEEHLHSHLLTIWLASCLEGTSNSHLPFVVAAIAWLTVTTCVKRYVYPYINLINLIHHERIIRRIRRYMPVYILCCPVLSLSKILVGKARNLRLIYP